MSTSMVTERCRSCGADIFGTRFCEACGEPVEAFTGPAAVTEPKVAAVQTPATIADPAQRVRLGFLLALNAVIWTPIVPLMTAVTFSYLGQALGRSELPREMWFISGAAAVIPPAIMVAGFVLAARYAPLSPRSRGWAIALAAVAGLLNAFSAVLQANLFAGPTAVGPGLGALAIVGAWGMIARFRGPGYWALVYTVVASVLLSAVAIFGYVLPVVILSVPLWVGAVLAVVALARRHERRAAAWPHVHSAVVRPAPAASGRTNGFAVASLVLSLLGGGVFAIIFGHLAHSQIRQTGDSGSGMATAGLVIGYISIALSVTVTIVVAVLVSTGAWR